MKIIYRAFDSKEFDCELDCEAYERRIGIEDDVQGTRFFDQGKNPIPLVDLSRCIEAGWYVFVPTAKAAKGLNKYAKEEAGLIYDFSEVGYYYYDEDNDEWRLVEELLNKYNEIMNIFEG